MIEMHRETEQLGAYALGALDEHEAAEMAAHIEQCPTCRRELAELESVRDLLGDLPPEAMLDGPPEDGELLLQRTLWQVRAETRSYQRRRPLLAVAAAVAAIALLGAGNPGRPAHRCPGRAADRRSYPQRQHPGARDPHRDLDGPHHRRDPGRHGDSGGRLGAGVGSGGGHPGG